MSHGPLSPLHGRRAVVTGHTGFKGAWLAAWLEQLGAEVHGIAQSPPAEGAYHDLGIASCCASTVELDVRDGDGVAAAIAAASPDIVFHLAAQPLVRRSWIDRRATFETNVLGTVNVLEAALAAAPVAAVVVVTTDKVYENKGAHRPFVEGDRLGGHDPYSASKAAAELAIEPYRHARHMGLREVPIVVGRAGNVIGGGDYSDDRLIPDIVRALRAGRTITLRRPDATRPWQHVLDCLWGYLLAGAALLDGRELSPAYNFSHGTGARTVLEVAEAVVSAWGAGPESIVIDREDTDKEAFFLQLDPALAMAELGWLPAWDLDTAIAETVRFYRSDDPASVGRQQIASYESAAHAARAAI